MMVPEIDSRTGEVIFPEIPNVTLLYPQYSPYIDDRTKMVKFPPIKQDNDTTFCHNVCQTMDELNTELEDKPKVLLSVGTNAPDEHDEDTLEPHLIDDFYTHKLLKQLVENLNYIPTSIALNRDEYQYGDTTLIHLNNPRSDNQKFLYEHDLQVSLILAYLISSYPPET